MVGSVVYGLDEQIAGFVAARIPQMLGARFNEPFNAIGIVRDGSVVGGVVFYNKRFGPDSRLVDLEMSAAFDSPDCCRPSTLATLFKFPFGVLGAERMTTITARGNKRARMIDEALGFKLEGVHDCAIDGKEDAISYGMLRKNCLWLDPARRGEAFAQVHRVRAKWKKSDGR